MANLMHILSSTDSNLNDQTDYFLSIWTFFLYSVGVILYSEQKADVNLFGLIYPIFAAISATDNCPSLNIFSAICSDRYGNKYRSEHHTFP